MQNMDTGNKKSSGPLGGEHFKFPAAGLLIVLLAMGRMAGVLAQQMAAGAPPTERVETRYVRPVPTGYQPSKGAGLTVEIAAGRAPYNGTHVHYSGGGLTMAPSATN